MSQNSWICDGEPKNGQQYGGGGSHPPQENFGPDCVVCGLPKEAMSKDKSTTVQTTVVSPGNSRTVLSGNANSAQSNNSLLTFGIIGVLILLMGGGLFWFFTKDRGEETVTETTKEEQIKTNTKTGDSAAIVSDSAKNADLLSQGEKPLFDQGANLSQKNTAAKTFMAKNWQEAIQDYQAAYKADPNDPEAKIYFNNAKAKKQGNPLTMAVVVPISQSANEAKELLRGVAQYQDEFNEAAAQQLLEVVIVNEKSSTVSDALAEDLIDSPVNILGVLGHGVDSGSRLALARYERAKLAALSPINTAITTGKDGKSIVRTIPLSKSNTLLGAYLQKVGESLAKYAVKNHAPAQVAIFSNSDSPYSQRLADEVFSATGKAGGKVVKEIDITAANFDEKQAIKEAKDANANVLILALSKNKVDQAIELAKANKGDLPILGGDELYNPTILIKGDQAIEGLVLAVPWQWQSDNPFANQAANLWKGRVSWRTATTYDATQALLLAFTKNPGNRTAIFDELNQGITLKNSVTEFNIFNDIPLVKANPGKAGPSGSKYQFDPIK